MTKKPKFKRGEVIRWFRGYSKIERVTKSSVHAGGWIIPIRDARKLTKREAGR